MNKKRRSEKKHSPALPATLTDYVDDYLEHAADTGRRPGTIVKRRQDLLRLLDFLIDHGIDRVQDVRERDLADYASWLEGRDYKPRTVASFLVSCRVWFAWLAAGQVIFENPARALETVRVPFKLGLVLTEAQVRELLDQPDDDSLLGQRDRAMLEILYATGMRLGECAGLRVTDVDPEQELVKVHGKRDKERLLPLGSHAVRRLQAYLAKTRPQLLKDLPDPGALWLSRVGRPLGAQSIRLAVKRHATAAGLPVETDTHTLRRACATHMLRHGANPLMVARLLGHAELKTLSNYLKTSIRDLQKTHAETKPGK